MKQLITVLFLSISAIGFAQTGEKNFIDQNYIEVTGKAELEIVPDMIYLKIVLSDKDNKDKLILSEIEKVVIDRLSAIGVDVNKDLSLMDFASNMKSYLFKSNIVLTKQYQLIVHDSKTLQQVFYEFHKLGISSVSIEKLEHSKIEQHRKDVKVSAIKVAKEKAELLTAAIDQSIGRALYIQEADNLNPDRYSNTLNNALGGGFSKKAVYEYTEDMNSDIELEKIKIESTVLVRFELK